jgi:hypothetical protein
VWVGNRNYLKLHKWKISMKKLFTILLMVVLCTPVVAKDRFWTKKQVIGTSIDFAVRSIDSGQTCYHLNNGWHENYIPSQSCSGVIGWNLGAIGLEIGSYYFLHRTHHNKLQTINPYVWATPSAIGIIQSYTGEN